MRVIEARYDQRGELELLVDQIPTLETLRFQKLRIEDNPSEPGYLYVAEQDGYVDLFFQHDPDHGWYGQGYDGRQFTIFLEDGTAETLVGPWSSNTQLVNHYLPELAAQPVGLTHDRRVFQNLMATSAGAITAELRDDIVTRLQPTRPLGWLRHRYEALEAQLSSARPLPGRGVVQDSAAHQRWVTDNHGHFAEQALLLRAIAASSAAVRAAAHHRPDFPAGLAEVLPALREQGTWVPATVLEKVAVYYASYAVPGQSVRDVLDTGAVPGTTRHRELASIANDLGVALEATASTDRLLYGLWSHGASLDADLEAPDREGGASTYQDYVAHGVFAAYGRRTYGPASSLDDHYVGPFGDDWGSGPPSYDIGPSGTDEEHYAELGQYHLWLTAGALRLLEASGHKAIPHGAATVDVDRLLTTEFGPWLLDRHDPAIRAAAALQDPDLAASLFNTPDTQWIPGLGRDNLRHLGSDPDLAVAPVGGAQVGQTAEPWVPGDVTALLATAQPAPTSADLAAQARAATTADLLAWVQQAQLPRPTQPGERYVQGAREAAEALRRHRDEKQLELQGLRRELGQTRRWRRGSRARRAALEGRMASRPTAQPRQPGGACSSPATDGSIGSRPATAIVGHCSRPGGCHGHDCLGAAGEPGSGRASGPHPAGHRRRRRRPPCPPRPRWRLARRGWL